ncbi:sodium bicarbonate transporter-like protein 11 [Eurytemora carolleeae]|uniref:sodium bicarbonate transporter-like protein 11 n=1 Tax=Eurytemora carolleeae TaxID=1294199 RepID=UPI000C766EB7|nr:sodium bicarbonate transporter-like protein 11 [Eurytemora carolleeae]|eukprot:XP_023337083.1 sodium bicarbonate transporter-like protein 11 [Eurytemora affinis]
MGREMDSDQDTENEDKNESKDKVEDEDKSEDEDNKNSLDILTNKEDKDKAEDNDLEKDEHIDKSDLIATTHKPVLKKDFRVDVRGMKDMTELLHNASVELNLQVPCTAQIVDVLLESMLSKNKQTITKQEIKSLVFADEDCTSLAQVLQGRTVEEGSGSSVDQSWICSYLDIPTLANRLVGVAELSQGTNLGESAQEIRFFILVLCPGNVKGTKNSLETARTFSTLFSSIQLRHTLLQSNNEMEFKKSIEKAATELYLDESAPLLPKKSTKDDSFRFLDVGRGIRNDLTNRLPFYWSDFKDGVIGPKSIAKTISTSFFLYFSIILPAIAFGNLQDDNTSGRINVEKILIGQVFGGLAFSFFAGQPLVVVMTTAPLVLFTKIILLIAEDFDISFLPFYGMVGLWNSFFLFLYAFFNLSKLMKFSSRLIIFIGRVIIITDFRLQYRGQKINACLYLVKGKIFRLLNLFHASNAACQADLNKTLPEAFNLTSPLISALSRKERSAHIEEEYECEREVSLLYLILMVGTVWLGLTLFNFVKTPYLSPRKRELLSDYALPVAVVVFSIIGSAMFRDVKLTPFRYEAGQFNFQVVLFSAAMVNSPENRLKKGNAYHWDLVVISAINAILSIFGLPFMHAVLPHSPLHVRCLADVETRVEGGYARDVVTYVRETRLTNILSNIAIGLSLLFLPYVLKFVPKAVLDGLFLYMAITALYSNQMFERVSLLFTEQAAYPPNHYVKSVPQKNMHIFTCCQLVQLLVLCVFGFIPWPYAKMIFPVVLFFFLPIRHKLMPYILEKKYLEAIDPTQH